MTTATQHASWRRHDMETLYVLLATGPLWGADGFRHEGPVMRSFDIIYVSLNYRRTPEVAIAEQLLNRN